MKTMISFGAGLVAFGAIALGGIIALRFQDRLHLLLGLSGGIVLGVAFFDLIPESQELLADKMNQTTGWVALGFLVYHLFDRFIAIHTYREGGHSHGTAGALGFGLHAFTDGLALGLAFKAGLTIGLVVASAILFHNLSDGLNTVTVLLKEGAPRRKIWRWLATNSLMPLLGVLAAWIITVSNTTLGSLLGFFAGVFIALGTLDLLPEAHHRHSRWETSLATVIGLGAIYLFSRLFPLA